MEPDNIGGFIAQVRGDVEIEMTDVAIDNSRAEAVELTDEAMLLSGGAHPPRWRHLHVSNRSVVGNASACHSARQLGRECRR